MGALTRTPHAWIKLGIHGFYSAAYVSSSALVCKLSAGSARHAQRCRRRVRGMSLELLAADFSGLRFGARSYTRRRGTSDPRISTWIILW